METYSDFYFKSRLSPRECMDIVDLGTKTSKTHSSTLFEAEDINYFYIVIKREEKSQWIFDRFKSYTNSLYPDNSANLMTEVYLHIYPKGCKFLRHRDDAKYPDQVLNVGVTLSTDYKGGEFIAYGENKPDRKLGTVAGEFYHMDASTEHEVLEVTEGVRVSLIQFFTFNDLYKPTTI